MTFDFFTLGGSFFWEDVFFYKKWRIQRNCYTKKYRLLDSWDICRGSGTFTECQNIFIQHIKNYEILKQQGTMIILLHGYCDSKNIFKPLWRKLNLTNANVAALNYPSLLRSSASSAQQLLFFLNHLEHIDSISFVTKGAGNLVLQNILSSIESQPCYNKMKINYIVELNPVLDANLFCDFFAKFGLFRLLGGPMLTEMTEKNIKRSHRITANKRLLHLFATSQATVFWRFFLKLCHFSESKKYFPRGSIQVKTDTWNALKDEKVLNYIVKFINNGKI
jgi:hypothetical protein